MERHVISYRPIGYSWFLLLIHGIWASDTFLVFVQYCLLQLAGLYLYFSIDRLYRPRKAIGNILFYFLLLDPVILYIANLVSSDALFTVLTLVWLTELLWLIHRPGWGRMLLQLSLLVLLCNVRYNALYYPIVSTAAYLMTRRGFLFKLTGIVSGFLALWLYTFLIGQVTWRQTGAKTFSAFSGWQITNNMLYAYPYIEVDPMRLPSPECRTLDSMVKRYFDTAGFIRKGQRQKDFFYMWDAKAPMKQYMYLRQGKEHTDYFTAWNRVGPVFSTYGYYLLFHHPLAFVREYALHSAHCYFFPVLGEVQRYNDGEKDVDQTAVEWFHFHTKKISSICSPDLQAYILAPFPLLWLVFHVAALLAGTLLLVRRGKKFPAAGAALRKGLLLAAFFTVMNAAFAIFATPCVFRYQVGPMIFLFVFTLLAYDFLFSSWNPAPAIRKE